MVNDESMRPVNRDAVPRVVPDMETTSADATPPKERLSGSTVRNRRTLVLSASGGAFIVVLAAAGFNAFGDGSGSAPSRATRIGPACGLPDVQVAGQVGGAQPTIVTTVGKPTPLSLSVSTDVARVDSLRVILAKPGADIDAGDPPGLPATSVLLAANEVMSQTFDSPGTLVGSSVTAPSAGTFPVVAAFRFTSSATCGVPRGDTSDASATATTTIAFLVAR